MRWKKMGAVLAAAGIGTAAVFAPWEAVPAEAASLSSLKDQQAQIQKELDQVNDKLDELESDIAQAEQYQNTLTQQINLNQQKMGVMDQQLTQLSSDLEESEAQLAQTVENIAAKETEIEDTTDQYKLRMRAMYMAGETSSLELLLEAESFGDLLTNIEMMKAISQHDTELLETLRAQKTDLENQKTQAQRVQEDIKTQQADISAQKQEMQALNQELEAAYAESESAMQDVELEKQQFEQNAAAKIAEQKEIEAEIQAEIKRLQEENEKKQQAANGGKPTTFTDGRFIRPTNGGYYISSGYGSRWGSFHSGIDITAGGCYGAPIYAAASGTVITASSHWSYGNYVVIDHGGGYSTLYAHASSLAVSKGQYVNQGDVIAYIGSTGQSTGPHLHFEVRVNGNTQNPSNWVSY